MEELITTVVVALLCMVYILLIPVIMLVATPIILLWPGKKESDGTRSKRDIRGRYRKLWRIWESIGLGLPTP